MKASKLKKYKLSLYFLFFKKYRDYAAIVCLSVNDQKTGMSWLTGCPDGSRRDGVDLTKDAPDVFAV